MKRWMALAVLLFLYNAALWGNFEIMNAAGFSIVERDTGQIVAFLVIQGSLAYTFIKLTTTVLRKLVPDFIATINGLPETQGKS